MGGSLRGESLLREGVEDDEEEGNGEGEEVDGDESMEGGGRGGVILNGGRMISDGRRRVRSSREAVKAPNESLKYNGIKEEISNKKSMNTNNKTDIHLHQFVIHEFNSFECFTQSIQSSLSFCYLYCHFYQSIIHLKYDIVSKDP